MNSSRAFLAAAGLLLAFGPSRKSPPTASANALLLPKPFEYYARDQKTVAEFYAFVMNNKWNGHERTRKCHPAKTCNGTTTMVIEEVRGAQNQWFTKSVPKGQRILIGRLENTGELDDTLYWKELPAGQNAQGFVFLEGNDANQGYPVMIVITFHDNKGYLNEYTPDDPTKSLFMPCDKTRTDGYEADFKPCPNTRPPLAADDAVRIADASFSGAWFSCQEGCCGSSFPPVRYTLRKTTAIPGFKPKR